jgi:hypothetical protein
MRRYTLILVWLAMSGRMCLGQVDEIKKASSDHSGSGKSDSQGSSGSSYAAFEFANFTAQALIQWHHAKLQTRAQNPSIVSVEVMALGAVQPSSYYIIHPRIRGNWGLFSTDFRMNYLIEEDIDGLKHIRTDDWQIIELNIVTEPTFNFYVGFGFLHEAFNDDKYFEEWTACFRIMPRKFPIVLQAEYRYAVPRTEFNANIQYPILKRGVANLYIVAGGTFQQYYSTIQVWGMQGGIMMKIY